MFFERLRKPLILILALALCACMMAVQVFAEPAQEEEGDITIPIVPGETIDPGDGEDSEFCGENLNWTLDKDGVLTISGTGTRITAAPWEKAAVKSVVFKVAIEYIVENVFDGSTGLTCVFYAGTGQQWADMVLLPGNSVLAQARLHYGFEESKFCNKTCFYCSGCEAYLLPTGVEVKHSFTNYVSNGDATCTAYGTKTAKCDYCSATDTIVDETRPDHVYVYVYNEDATCTQDGTETGTCKFGCGAMDVRTKAGSKLDHKFTTYAYNDDATWEKDGTETAQCDYGCGTEDTRTAEGTKLPHGWVEEEGDTWYYYYKGKMTTGWLAYGPVWYYFNEDGVMRTGFLYYGGKYYYFDTAKTNYGRMVVNKWIQDSGKWYYFDGNGYMVTGEYTINGEKNLFDENGVWQGVVTSHKNGWIKEDNKWYYYKNGAKTTGWLDLNGTWYYFKTSGEMVTGWLAYGPVWYYFNPDGDMRTGWLTYGGQHYYFDTAVTNYGRMVVNKWIQDAGKWYYFDGNGYRVTGSKTIGGKTYNFDENGVCLNP